MQLRSLNVWFFFLLFLIVGTAVFFIMQPFLTAIVAAAILTTLFSRPYHWFEHQLRGHRSVSALLTCFLVVLIIITPLFLIFSLAVSEAGNLFRLVTQESSLQGTIERALTVIHRAPYADVFLNSATFDQGRIMADIRQLSQNALGLLQAAYLSITSFIFWVFVVFFTLFYFLIDGKGALRQLTRLSPLKDEHDKLLIQKFISISRATLKGTIIVGAIQGLLGGITFWIAGVPSPAIWGLVMILFSIIPMVGSGLVWLPAGLIMLLLGNFWQGIFIFAVGFGVISVIDNVLRPKLVGKDTEMHPLFVLFATLGGISLFGLSGFILGPIIMSLFIALSEIYSIEFRDQLKGYNE